MTAFELKNNLQKELGKADIENANEEARLLCEFVCDIKHGDFLFKRNEAVDEAVCKRASELCQRRINAEPLQYILGKWEFMGLEFKVGRGVLVPRPETEVLCEFVIDKIKNKEKAVVFDLCSGSGCIGLSLKHFVPTADVYMIEKSAEAVKYLEQNRINLGFARNTVAVQGDILGGYEKFSFLPKPDIIISNPPYIRTEEISLLQKEVQNEPFMALDGGEDGYVFYEALCEKWLPYIKDGGLMAVECGEEQAATISSMFMKNASETEIIKDFNNVERIVVAYCNKGDK